jgi:hypothetical protein
MATGEASRYDVHDMIFPSELPEIPEYPERAQ